MTFTRNEYIISGLILLFCKTVAAINGIWISYGTSCYFISSETQLYESLASVECLKIGAHLVEVTSPEEHDILTPYLDHTEQYWVGMEKNETGDFVWILDRSGPFVPWTSWDIQTSTASTSMVRYRWDYNTWILNMRTNSMDYRYICEKSKSYINQISCVNDVGEYLVLTEKVTSSSSTYSNNVGIYGSAKVTDDSLSSCALTELEDYPWWQIDLSNQTLVHSVEIVSLNCCGNANILQKLKVSAYVTEPNQTNEPIIKHVCGSISLNMRYTMSAVIQCTSNTIGRYIRLTKKALESHLVLCDIKIKGKICTNDVTEKKCSAGKSYNTYTFNVQEKTTKTVQASSSITSCQIDIMTSTLQQSDIIPTSTLASVSTAQSYSSQGPYSSAVPVEDEFDEVVRKMKVDRKATKAYRRSLISAEDKRMSSRVSGYIGIFILITVLCVLLFFDALRFYNFLAIERR